MPPAAPAAALARAPDFGELGIGFGDRGIRDEERD
jgi:hypothetical protein